jgi:hypothetical protein
MLFVFVSIIVPILIYVFLPWFIWAMSGKKPVSRALLAIAGLVFFVSWYLPSPEIQGQDTSAVTHFVGGGIFTGLTWLYIKRQLRWQAHWLVELTSLLALVSLLGVANELFELAIVQIGLVDITLDDTPWDLLMNTLGALTAWLSYVALKRPR